MFIIKVTVSMTGDDGCEFVGSVIRCRELPCRCRVTVTDVCNYAAELDDFSVVYRDPASRERSGEGYV